MNNRFFKKISIYFIGTLSSNIINVLLVPVYAYFVSAADLGEYDYILSIASMVTPILFLVIWEAILKYCINEDKNNVYNYFSTAFAFCGGAIGLCVITMLLLVAIGGDKEFYLLVALFVIVDGMTSFWQFGTRALGESKQYVIAGIVGSIIVIVCDFWYIIYGNLNYFGLATSHILSQLVVIMVLEKKAHLLTLIKFKHIKKDILKKMICFSGPLVLNTVCMWFYTGGNKIIVRNYIGSTENGLFSFASKFSVLVNFCSTIVSMAVIEESYSYNNLHEYKCKIGKLIAIISKAYFSMIALALPAIFILYSIAFQGTEYYKSSKYVYMLLLSALFTALSNNFGSSFQVTEKTKLIFVTTVVGAISSLIVSILTVSWIGIWGILFGSVIGPFVMMLLRAIYAKKATGLSINWKDNIFIVFVSGIVSMILGSFDDLLLQIIIFLCMFVFLLYLYRKEIILYKK